MTGILPTSYLTTGHAPELAEQIRMSRPGMGHFAGTGPAGTCCGGCRFLNDMATGKEGKARRWAGCQKYLEITGRHGDTVPRGTPSCRYYEPKK